MVFSGQVAALPPAKAKANDARECSRGYRAEDEDRTDEPETGAPSPSGASLSDATPLIELAGVTKTYRTGDLAGEVLPGLDLKIYPGEFVAIVGQSGSGKSTLMNILGCLDRPTTGSYRFNGEDVSAFGRDELAKRRREAFGLSFRATT